MKVKGRWESGDKYDVKEKEENCGLVVKGQHVLMHDLYCSERPIPMIRHFQP